MRNTKRGQQVRHLVEVRGRTGVTWREVADNLQMHHGSASGALSNLHAKGWVVRLAEKREGCAVYVAPNFVADRPTAARRAVAPRNLAAETADSERVYAEGRLAGLAEGRDAGWTEGYDAGIAATPPVSDKTAYKEGLVVGRREGARVTQEKVTTLVMEMRRAMGSPSVRTHTTDCWRRHPECILTAVEKRLR